MIQWRERFPRLSAILRNRVERRDVDKELRSHLEMRIQDNIDSGMTPSEARDEAYRRFGNFLRTETTCLEIRNVKKEKIMEALLHDIRYGFRVLRKNPGVTIIAVITLALGIGANSSIFSIVNTVLLRPLPYQAPDRLVQFWETNPKRGWTEATVAPGNFLDWQKQSQSFQEMGAYIGSDGRGATLSNFALTGNGDPERIQGLSVTGNMFSVLGVSPLIGRTFIPEETWSGKNRVVVLSHGLWQTRFGGNPQIIGKQIALNGNNYTVLGVMPADFLLPTKDVQIWVPVGWNPNTIPQQRVPHYLRVVGRLKPGITLDQARQEMTAIASRLEEQYPNSNTKMGVGLGPMLDWDVASTRKPLYIFLGAVAFVLLIACTNVANLLLARATARKKEFALRAALGAGRGRLVRQLLAESLVLSGLGGVLGLLLAVVCNRLLVAFSPGNIPRFNDIKLDSRVVLFTFGLTVITSVMFGLLPAVSGSKTDLNEALKDGGQKGGRGSREKGVQGFLVVSEIALSLVLIVGAGLMIKSFVRLQQVDPGFDAKNLLTLQLSLPPAKYSQDQQVVNFYQQAMDRIKGLPGVNSVGMTTRLPLMGYHWTSDFVIEPRSSESFTEVRHKDVTPDYFRTMHIPVLKGRAFTDADSMDSPHVVIINDTLSRRYFGNDDPVGKRIKFGNTDRDKDWLTIVGVAGDEKQDGLTAEVKPEVFQPWAQFARENMVLAIRTNGDPRNSITAIREQIRAVDPELPAFNIRTMEDVVSVSVARQRFAMLLLTIFAVIALVLASVGIYGVMSYTTAQRTNEIGIRMALGARPSDVMKLVLGQGLKFVVAGLALGLIGSAILTSLMMSLLFGVSATDPVTFLSVSLLLSMVALIACYIPARRAISVDPISALNHE